MAELSPDELTDLLLVVVNADEPHAALRERRELLTMERVVALASTDAGHPPTVERLATVLAAEIDQAAGALEDVPEREPPNRTTAARAAFGLAVGTQGLPLRGTRRGAGRLAAIASQLDTTPDAITRDGAAGLRALLRALAVALHQRETEFIATQAYLRQRILRRPEESALAVRWLERFERYFQVWTQLQAMRSEVSIAVRASREGDVRTADRFTLTSLFYHIEFTRKLKSFHDDHGGIWLLVDARREGRVTEAVYDTLRLSPFTSLEQSRMRVLSPTSEPADFEDAIAEHAFLRERLDQWSQWMHRCSCDVRRDAEMPTRPDPDCGLHSMLIVATSFMDDLVVDWESLPDWHTQRPLSSTADPGTRFWERRQP